MTLTVEHDSNYAAQVVRIEQINTLEGCDNIVGAVVFGYQAIVGKDVQVGDLMIFFPAESQLSDSYVSANNLYSSSERNADKTAKGYLGNQRRVRAMKLRKHRSDALLMPLSSIPNVTLTEGDIFDTVDEGVAIRFEGLEPRIYKLKSPKFFEHETKLLDSDEADLESIA